MTYGDDNFSGSKKRLIKEAKKTNLFKRVETYGPESLDEDFRSEFKEILSQPKIAGYGLWRPYIIKKELNKTKPNDFLIYLDAGCTINQKGKKRFFEYIDILNNSSYGIISFQMTGKKNFGSLHVERNWTIKEIFDYFEVSLESEIALSGQYLDGILIMKNNDHLKKIIDLWLDCVFNNAKMFTDCYNAMQFEYFKGNRHEQSVFSLIRKIHGSVVIDSNETYVKPFGCEESLKYPFWATRIRN